VEFYKGLLKAAEKDSYRYHMPGHKGKKDIFGDFEKNIVGIDFTEVEGTDNLHNPQGIIKDLQKRLSEIYGTRKTYVLINGSTVGLQSAILSQTVPKDKIIIQRDCHKAVYNSIILGDLNQEYIWTNFNKDIGIKEPVNIDSFEKQIKNSGVKVVVVTYPTYYGICSDIEKIAQITHDNNALLIVDEAHGAHLKFSKKLPKPAEELGADIVVQSLHKTLPAFTQTSALHVCSNRVDIQRLESFLKMLQSSSPSYVLMASVDKALDYMVEKGSENIDNVVEEIRILKKRHRGLFLDKEEVENQLGCNYDESKLLINLYDKGITGGTVEKVLRESYGVYTELWDIQYDLAYVSPADSIDDIRYLFNSVKEISENFKDEVQESPEFEVFKPNKKLSIREAFYSNKKKVNLEDGINSTSGEFIIPYPPGIPVICPGELIEDKHVEYFKRLMDENVDILGIEDNCISILK
jgi:lysine decarboxylase